jgi:ribosomal-protein-alanine N-acetyltransferase
MRIATRYAVRTMTVADIPQVLEVEKESFPTMWPPTAFKRELQQNQLAHYIAVVERNPSFEAPLRLPMEAHNRPGAFERLFGEVRHLLGSEEDTPLPSPEQRAELIVGFIGVWLLPDEAHIVTFGVRQSRRRQGVGELLLISAIELAQAKGTEAVTLECRVSNAPALALYQKYGFEKVGLRPRYYSDDREDAYVLTVGSVSTTQYRARFEQLKAEHWNRLGEYDPEG